MEDTNQELNEEEVIEELDYSAETAFLLEQEQEAKKAKEAKKEGARDGKK